MQQQRVCGVWLRNPTPIPGKIMAMTRVKDPSGMIEERQTEHPARPSVLGDPAGPPRCVLFDFRGTVVGGNFFFFELCAFSPHQASNSNRCHLPALFSPASSARGWVVHSPAWFTRATLAMIPSAESEANRRKNKSGDYEVSPQASKKEEPATRNKSKTI